MANALFKRLSKRKHIRKDLEILITNYVSRIVNQSVNAREHETVSTKPISEYNKISINISFSSNYYFVSEQCTTIVNIPFSTFFQFTQLLSSVKQCTNVDSCAKSLTCSLEKTLLETSFAFVRKQKTQLTRTPLVISELSIECVAKATSWRIPV